jgi:hypothetical protein
MSRNDAARSMHPAQSLQIEDKLTTRRVRFTFEANLPIDRVRDVEGIQVRLIEHRAPKAMVDRYAEQMKGGATFPAIVVNDRYELVDGNTRWLAAQRNKMHAIAAYVCSDLSALQARSLSVELNQSNGLSMTEEEIHRFVASAIEERQVLDTKACARMTGVKSSTLGRWVAAKRFEMRAGGEGISSDRLAGLSDSTKASLQTAKLRAVFVAVLALAIEAQVPANEVKAIIAEANAAPSEAEALAVVTEAREVRSERIKDVAAGFKRSRRKSAGSALHIGGLLRFEVADLLDVSPEQQTEMFSRMHRLWQRLDGALALARVEWDISSGT